jgi:hypothetical protein
MSTVATVTVFLHDYHELGAYNISKRLSGDNTPFKRFVEYMVRDTNIRVARTDLRGYVCRRFLPLKRPARPKTPTNSSTVQVRLGNGSACAVTCAEHFPDRNTVNRLVQLSPPRRHY